MSEEGYLASLEEEYLLTLTKNKMTKEIALFSNKINNKELLTDPNHLQSILTEIKDLGSLVFDLSTNKGVEEAQSLKPKATEFVKDLKAFCEPYEADGKRISDARSTITTRLLTGKESVINKILEPIVTIDKKLKALNIQIVTPINDLHSCDVRLQEVEELQAYNWLAFKEEADKLIQQQITIVTATRDRIEKEAKAEQNRLDNERREREAFIAKNAAENARRETEERIKREQEYKEEQERIKKASDQAMIYVEQRAAEVQRLNVEHRKKINNEILEALGKLACQSDGDFIVDMKYIIKAIAKGEIPHVSINY